MEKEKRAKTIKRTITGVIAFPILAVILIFSNTIIMDIFTAIIACISMYEYFHCFKSTKKANPSQYLGYIFCILIAFTHFVDERLLAYIMVLIIPFSLVALFTELVLSKGEKNIKDIAVTMLGIYYIPLMIIYLSLIRNMDLENGLNGKILIWFVLIASWGSDVFAYFIGRHFGKHKLTKISPNKTVEGAVAGIVGAILLGILFAVLCNTIWNVGINYLVIAIIMAILSAVGQIGDLAASSIKRYCEIKDFSELIPGHGGMLDRIDSIIFVLPFAYILFSIL